MRAAENFRTDRRATDTFEAQLTHTAREPRSIQLRGGYHTTNTVKRKTASCSLAVQWKAMELLVLGRRFAWNFVVSILRAPQRMVGLYPGYCHVVG
jgi:hypothetical protein